jgi:hypothetical protein
MGDVMLILSPLLYCALEVAHLYGALVVIHKEK